MSKFITLQGLNGVRVKIETREILLSSLSIAYKVSNKSFNRRDLLKQVKNSPYGELVELFNRLCSIYIKPYNTTIENEYVRKEDDGKIKLLSEKDIEKRQNKVKNQLISLGWKETIIDYFYDVILNKGYFSFIAFNRKENTKILYKGQSFTDEYIEILELIQEETGLVLEFKLSEKDWKKINKKTIKKLKAELEEYGSAVDNVDKEASIEDLEKVLFS